MLSQQAEAQDNYSKPFLKKVDNSFLFLIYLCIYIFIYFTHLWGGTY